MTAGEIKLMFKLKLEQANKSEIARKIKMARITMYDVCAVDGNPRLNTLINLAEELGLEIHVSERKGEM